METFEFFGPSSRTSRYLYYLSLSLERLPAACGRLPQWIFTMTIQP